MNLIRKIKISKLVDNTFTEKEKEIVNIINSWLKDLIPFKMHNIPESIFYMTSEGLFALEQDNKTDILWVRYYGIWEILRVKYSMEYSDIQILHKYLIEEAFKQKVSTPQLKSYSLDSSIEETFKQLMIEQAFKQTISR